MCNRSHNGFGVHASLPSMWISIGSSVLQRSPVCPTHTDELRHSLHSNMPHDEAYILSQFSIDDNLNKTGVKFWIGMRLDLPECWCQRSCAKPFRWSWWTRRRRRVQRGCQRRRQFQWWCRQPWAQGQGHIDDLERKVTDVGQIRREIIGLQRSDVVPDITRERWYVLHRRQKPH